VTRKVVLSPTDLLELSASESATCRFLRQILPYGIRSTSNMYGIEGFHLKDVLGIVALTVPSALTTKAVAVDVETRGELTRGMSVIDARSWRRHTPNAEMAVGIEGAAVRDYIQRILGRTA
jgi:inosine-uridine nucleoside N-ribohydrolase